MTVSSSAEDPGGTTYDQLPPADRRPPRRAVLASLFRSQESLVFCHPQLGTPLDPSKVSGLMPKAITKAGIERPVRPWHDLRHTAQTHDAAAGNPAVYVQARAGHAQATMTERYGHAAQVAFPGAAERSEERLFSAVMPRFSETTAPLLRGPVPAPQSRQDPNE